MFPNPQLVYVFILSMIGIQNASRVSRTTCTSYRMVQRAKRWPGLVQRQSFSPPIIAIIRKLHVFRLRGSMPMKLQGTLSLGQLYYCAVASVSPPTIGILSSHVGLLRSIATG